MDRPESRFYEQILSSIYGDEIVMDFALLALEAEQLGRRGTLDILSISLSSNDAVGHNFGPDSVEAKEVTHGLDRQVGRLLARLDHDIGPDRYLLVLTADHGVGFSPEAAAAHGYAGGRWDSGEVLRRINRRLNFTIRYPDWSLGFAGPGYFFDPDALRFGGRQAGELEGTVADVIRETSGIAEVYTRSDILSGRLPDTEITRKVRAGFHATRSPDVYVVADAFRLEGSVAASHGSPYVYDTHVPVIFYGAGLPTREVVRQINVMDIARTLSALLRTAFPSGSAGAPLPEVLENLPPGLRAAQGAKRL
jgi:arylsulfatase A-like enzyme